VEVELIIARLIHGEQPRWVAIEESETYRLFSSERPWERPDMEETRHRLNNASMLEPAVPTKILAVGLNYTDHAAEMKMQRPEDPVLFMKPVSSLLPPGGVIIRPANSIRVDHEAELAVVMKKRVRNASSAEAKEAIWGYTCCNDVTARDLQTKDGQWTRAKGFDTFCPLGPWLVTDFEEKDQEIICRVNGVVKQSSRLSCMMWKASELVSFISRIMPLEPLDVVITGTPAGIGPLTSGDSVEVFIEGIGGLVNRVR
jgi:2-keto-4-pentenoate hydratase/2-oxohepta-3-ene-1,7-dioic acid hydratase in catechol pathway